MTSFDQLMMQEAVKQASIAFKKDEIPIGAVIVHKNQIVAKAHNQVEMLKDPTAHAEMIVLTQASSTLSCKWLHDCVMYVTIEPCFMCAGALVLSRIKKLFYGATDPKAGACGTLINVAGHPQLNHRIEVFQGLLQEECGGLMSDFFKKKRKSYLELTN